MVVVVMVYAIPKTPGVIVIQAGVPPKIKRYIGRRIVHYVSIYITKKTTKHRDIENIGRLRNYIYLFVRVFVRSTQHFVVPVVNWSPTRTGLVFFFPSY